MKPFCWGMLTMASVVASLFFLRYWRRLLRLRLCDPTHNPAPGTETRLNDGEVVTMHRIYEN